MKLFDDVRRKDADREVILAKDEAHDVNAATQGGDAAGRQRQMQEPILQSRSHAWMRARTHRTKFSNFSFFFFNFLFRPSLVDRKGCRFGQEEENEVPPAAI